MDDIIIRYTGGDSGAFIIGVPKNDLTQADYDLLSPFSREELDGMLNGHAFQPCYQWATPQAEKTEKPSKASKAEPTPEPVAPGDKIQSDRL